MAGQQMYPGLLTQFGLDLDPQVMKEQDLRRQQEVNVGMANNLGYRGTVAGAAQGGALLAAALGNRGYKPKDEEQRKIEAAKMAGESMNGWLAQNPGVSERDKSMMYQKLLGEAAFKQGIPDVGSAIMEQYDQKEQARKVQDTELERLGIQRDTDRFRYNNIEDEQKAKRTSWGLAEQVTAWPSGSNDPATAKDLRYEKDERGYPTGNLVDANGNVVYQQGEYTTHAPSGGGAGGGGGDFLINASDAAQHRAVQTAAIQMMDGVEQIDDIIVGAATRDGKVDILGWGGAVAGKATELADNIESTMSNIGKALGVGPGGVEVEINEYDKKTGKRKTVSGKDGAGLYKEYANDIDATMSKYIPAALRVTGNDAIRVRQNLLNVAYAIMRAQEPGNNRYSDADFRHALELAGEGLADPNKLRATLYDRVQHATKAYDIVRMQIPKEAHGQVWAKGSMDYFEQRRNQFDKRFHSFAIQPAGRGAAPSPSGAGTPAVVSDDEGWSLISASP